MKKLRTKYYQWQANYIIKLIKSVPKDMVEYVYISGMNLNKKAIDKGIWLN